MNKFNLLTLRKYGVLAEVVSTEGGSPHLVINLPSGRRTGIAAPPFPFESNEFSTATAHLRDEERIEFKEHDPSCAVFAQVLLVLARQGQKAAAAMQNANLSPQGRHALVVEAQTAALAEIGRHYAALLAIGVTLERTHAELYAVPAADVASAIVDVELRAEFRAMSTANQIDALAKVGEPEFKRLLFALKRAPLPHSKPNAELLDEAWAAGVCKAKGEQAATLKIAQENHAWAMDSTVRVAAIVANPSTSGSAGEVDRFTAYEALRSTGGAGVLEFADHEVRSFERRIAQAAA